MKKNRGALAAVPPPGAETEPQPKAKGPKLRPETRAWVEEVRSAFKLEGHHERLLILAATAYDRAAAAREAIEEHGGPTFIDRFRQPKLRPEVTVERDSMNSFRMLVRELGLDLPGPGEGTRAPRIGG